MQCDIQNSNSVWHSYLLSKDFKKHPILDTMTFEEFATTHSNGLYVVGTGAHVAVVRDGVILDNWDSSDEQVSVYFTKEKD